MASKLKSRRACDTEACFAIERDRPGGLLPDREPQRIGISALGLGYANCHESLRDTLAVPRSVYEDPSEM
jgi:hypothetical protein